MAAVGFACVTGEVATGTSAKTIVQVVAAANHAVWVKAAGISFKGTSNTATPIKVDLVRQTDAGTSSALTPVKTPADDSAETLQSTARHTATAEPTTTDVVWSTFIHAQTGVDYMLPFGGWIKVGGGDRLGIRVTAAADVNCIATLTCEE